MGSHADTWGCKGVHGWENIQGLGASAICSVCISDRTSFWGSSAKPSVVDFSFLLVCTVDTAARQCQLCRCG